MKGYGKMPETLTYQARGKWVIIRKEKRGLVRGLEMPETSAESTDFIVESIGDLVEALEIGDSVMIAGRNGEEYFPLVGDSSRLVIDERLVPYIIYRNQEA